MWLKREISIYYPDAKTIMSIGTKDDYRSLGLTNACFDGCAFETPDVIVVKDPDERLSFLIDCRNIMHDKSILFVQTNLDIKYTIKVAKMRLVKLFKEGQNFVFVIRK
jgi:hypothetical protein